MLARVVETGKDRAAWLDRRRQGITATDVARLTTGGASVLAAIRAEKMGHERQFSTRATEWGNEREPIIASHAQREWGYGHNRALMASIEDPRFLATPDLIGSDDGGDIKTTVHDWQTWADVPRRYLPQMGWQMIVMGWDTSRLVFEPHTAFVPLYPWPKDFVLDWDMLTDAGFGRDALIETAVGFLEWDGEPDEDAADLDALLREYLEEYELATAQARRSDAVKARIEEYLEHQPRKFTGSYANLTRSADGTTTTFDKEALAKEFPHLDLSQFTKTSRRKGSLRITPTKEAE